MAVILRDADLLSEWEDFMASITNSLRLKYGLTNVPSEAQAEAWASLVRSLESQGFTRDLAGREAAKRLFTDFQTKTYAGEADTIEYLLQQVAQKK